jgi:hypothetical protein
MRIGADEQQRRERDALMHLYNATDGLRDNSGWGSAKPVWEWRGVACDEHGFVVKLRLSINWRACTIYLLQDSLSRNSKVLIFFNASPAPNQ